MTTVTFLLDDNGLCGFDIAGHSTESCDDQIGKIVCAAVSSAAYMAANTVLDVFCESSETEIDDARMLFSVKNPSDAARGVLKGFQLHIGQLSDQYSKHIKILGGANHVKD